MAVKSLKDTFSEESIEYQDFIKVCRTPPIHTACIPTHCATAVTLASGLCRAHTQPRPPLPPPTQEITLISRLRHPNLVAFLGVRVNANPPCIVSELMEGGSVEDLYELRAREARSPWTASRKEIHAWTTDILRALRLLQNATL